MSSTSVAFPPSSSPPRWITATLTASTVQAMMDQAARVRSWVHAFEVRLDFLAGNVEVPWDQLPLPAIATCRPPREGGHFTGPEDERLNRLRAAARAGAAMVDVEWDAVDRLGEVPVPRIVSRHLFDRTPDDLLGLWSEVAATGGEVVKIATQAQTLTDALRVCTLYQDVSRPTIAIAMGPAGIISRLLALAHASGFLTYVAVTEKPVAAPGQVHAREMVDRFAADRIRAGARCYGYLAPDALTTPLIYRVNSTWRRQWIASVLLPLPLTPEDNLEAVLQLAWPAGLHGVWMPRSVAARWGVRLAGEGGWVYPDGRIGETPIEAPET